jgi:hypothetical protein
MKSNPGWIAAAGLLLLLYFLPAHTQTTDAEIELGLAAYKNSHYEKATIFKRQSIAIPPTRAHTCI